MKIELSVVIPTRNRAEVLRHALDHLSSQQTVATWELIIVDNGSSDSTQEVLNSFATKLRMKPLFEATAGKSRALNRALDVVSGTLVAFTDDDALVPNNWVSEFVRASRTHPEADVFCGPIAPVFPPGTPVWLKNHPFATAAFAKFNFGRQECSLPPPVLPFGPNFAVRKTASDSVRFRSDLGPSQHDTLLSDETNFLKELRKKGAKTIYVPSITVLHLIRTELVDIRSLYERAFVLGRSIIRDGGHAMLVKRRKWCMEPDCALFSQGSLINFYLGQRFEESALDVNERVSLAAALDALRWSENPNLFCASAKKWLSDSPSAPASSLISIP